MNIRTIERRLTDGSRVYDVALRKNHNEIIFRCVSEADATHLRDEIESLVTRHTTEVIENRG